MKRKLSTLGLALLAIHSVAPAAPSALAEVVIQCDTPASALAVGKEFRLTPVRAFYSSPNIWIFRAASVDRAQQVFGGLKRDSRVRGVFLNERVTLKKDFVPNDPYYLPNYPTAGWPGQWYLNDPTAANLDIEAPAAWLLGTGTGVIVGIVDDGTETFHPDLSANYSSPNSFNFGNGTANPSPATIEDNHGTALAGIIAGRGGNNTGITGVMATGKWAGLRIDFNNLTTAQIADATLFNSSGANTNIKIKNHSYGPDSPYADGSVEVAALATSSASGTIHVRSAGNLRGTTAEDVNKAAVRNSVNSITVAAIDSRGKFADYSSFGASVFVCAPSGSIVSGTRPILTTDRFTADAGFNQNGTTDLDPLTDGAYTSLFGTDFDGGTSVAAGLVSGSLGIAEGLNANLDTRFAKHLLARTSRQIDLTDATYSGDTWRTNNAGFKFNQNYGFGLINAGALAGAAGQWFGPTSLSVATISTTAVGTSIPDNNATGVSRTFTITDNEPLEEVLLGLSISHVYRGDLEVFLTSPRGTKSRIVATNFADDGDNVNWTFSSNAFWGELPNGLWTIQVRDQGATDVGTWTNYAFTARMGTLSRRISGTINFGDIAGPTPVPVTFELRNSTTNALISTQVQNLASGQTFNIDTTASGGVNLVAVTPNWLRKSVALNLTTGTTTAGAVNLTNGDPDQSGEVDAADIDLVIANFGASGTGAIAGDLDWSGEVDAADIDIAIANFGGVGD